MVSLGHDLLGYRCVWKSANVKLIVYVHGNNTTPSHVAFMNTEHSICDTAKNHDT